MSTGNQLNRLICKGQASFEFVIDNESLFFDAQKAWRWVNMQYIVYSPMNLAASR